MALKIRCDECRKKISIDEAFAGGVCRCPYCKALVDVPGVEEKARGARPETPGERPETPETAAPASRGAAARPSGAASAGRAAAAAAPEHIPMARPVKVQGIVTLVLLGGMLVMVVGGGYMLMTKLSVVVPPAPTPSTATAPAIKPVIHHTAASGPAVLDVPIKPPVIYCIDAGSSMSEPFDYAVAVTKLSIKTIPQGGQFNIVLATEGGVKFLSAEGYSAAAGSEAAVNDLFLGLTARGASNLEEAFNAMAARTAPATITLFARKGLDSTQSDRIVAQVKKTGAKLICIAIGEGRVRVASMEKLAKDSGGQYVFYTTAELDDWIRTD